jgi:hypothetical protein
MSYSLNRGEATNIAFTITDQNNTLVGKRVTYSISLKPNGPRVLRKVGGLPGSSADITIATQTAGQITGTINLSAADTAALGLATYYGSLWVDDNAGNDRCATPNGAEAITVVDTVARAA